MRATEFLKETGLSSMVGKLLAKPSDLADTDDIINKLTALAGSQKPAQSTKPVATRSIDSDKSDNSTSGATSAQVGKDGSIVIGNQKRTGGTVSWRANNPGNVMYGSFSKGHGAVGYIKAADAEPVAIMPTLDHGWKMQMDLWRRPAYNNGTIDQGARRWAGAVGAKKETSQYTIDLARAAGVTIHTKVSSLSDDQLKRLVKKQAHWEGFKPGTVTQL
jgi:hypothetical protein